MANIRSAIKAIRSSAKKRMRNKSTKSALKTYISEVKRLIAGNQVQVAAEAIIKVTSALDKAAQKGIIHANKAARQKSRLMEKLDSAQKLAAAEAAATAATAATAAAAAAAAPEPEAARPKRRTTRRAQPKA